MADEIIKKVRDNYLEHELHAEVPDPECSECYKVLNEHDCKGEEDRMCELCTKFANIITD